MESLSYSRLRPAAEDALQAACYSPKRLVLLHTGVTLAIGLVISLLTYMLDMGIAQTGGLSGIGNRAMLQSLESFLTIASTILLPFWEVGYLYAVLQFARRNHPQTDDLFAGFRNWGVVLRGMLLKGAVVFAVMFIGTQITTTIYVMTPAAAPLQQLYMELLESGADPMSLVESEEYMALMMQAMPFILIGVGLLVIPVLYLLRFTDYFIMDQPELGARFALAASFRMTRRHLKDIFKLDLHFWWYYLLELLVVLVSYGHMILDILGVDLGMGGDTAMFVFYILSLAGQLGLYVWMKNRVYTTYALAYDCICPPFKPMKKEENPELY